MGKCSIIGSGDSLRGYDIDSIDGYRIGINYVYRYTDTDMNVGFDNPHKCFKDAPYIESLDVYGGKWHNEGGTINFKEGCVSNLNYTIFMALNIGIHKGFTDFHFYGCDNYVDKYLHFYDDQPISQINRDKYQTNFARIDRLFNHIQRDLYDYELTFYNSKITHFNNAVL